MAESEQDGPEAPQAEETPPAVVGGSDGGRDSGSDVRRAPAGPQDPPADPAEPMNPA